MGATKVRITNAGPGNVVIEAFSVGGAKIGGGIVLSPGIGQDVTIADRSFLAIAEDVPAPDPNGTGEPGVGNDGMPV